MKRVLALCDFACATGFSQVAQNVLGQVLKTEGYQIDVVAINYFGMPVEWQGLYPTMRLFPASFSSGGDVFGRRGLLNLLGSGEYDILWTLQDTFIIETIAQGILDIRQQLLTAGKKPFKWIFYFPIDAPVKENWITKAVMLADFPVAYTQFGLAETKKWLPEGYTREVRVIPHGVDTKVFAPLSEEDKQKFRHHYFTGLADGKFLVTNVNRNQIRKDIPSTMKIFSLLKQRVPHALLYLHMKKNDVGWNIDEVARNYNLIPDKDYLVPNNFDENTGLPVEAVAAIYNASDVVMTTSYGEGWGLSMTEAMACRTLVAAPDHTSLHEIVEGRGVLVPAGVRQTDWVCLSQDNERLRPKVDIPAFVEVLTSIAQNPEMYEPQRQAGYEYALSLDWPLVGQKWLEVFDKASADPVPVVGRNDPCFCGSGKKYKHCHGVL